MKKAYRVILSLSLAVVMLVASNIYAKAEEYSNYSVASSGNLISDKDIEQLSKKARKVADANNINIGIYITDNIGSYSIKNFSYDLYDKWFTASSNGVILVIYDDGSLENREYYIYPIGIFADVISSNRIDAIGDDMRPSLSDTDYAKACDIFLDDVSYGLDNRDNDFANESDYKSYHNKELIKKVLIGLGLALLFTILILMSMAMQLKSVAMNRSASSYEKEGSKHINQSKDIFLYHTITKTPKQKSNSSPSGSRTNQGGGGHF